MRLSPLSLVLQLASLFLVLLLVSQRVLDRGFQPRPLLEPLVLQVLQQQAPQRQQEQPLASPLWLLQALPKLGQRQQQALPQ